MPGVHSPWQFISHGALRHLVVYKLKPNAGKDLQIVGAGDTNQRVINYSGALVHVRYMTP